jgi:biotin synthase
MRRAAVDAARYGIDRFGIVTSGCSLDSKGVDVVCGAVRGRKSRSVEWCASLGELDDTALRRLRGAGLVRFHHNIETAESFFPRICTTHSFGDRLAMIRRVRRNGLEVCSGVILGMGESLEQRVEMAEVLRRERVDSIPLNFLVPVPGTRLARVKPMKPLDILRCVAMFRLVNPDAEIKVCAGRLHLRDLQSMVFHAGASGIMVGPLLTVAGRDPAADLQMLRDLEMAPSRDGVSRRRRGRGGSRHP